MIDRMIQRAMWLTVMGLIAAAAIGALILCYRGIYELCSRNLAVAAALIAPGVGLAIGSYLMARCGNDLMDR
jgi:hypothetical protein